MSFKRKKLFNKMLLLLVSLVVCLNNIKNCEQNENNAHKAYRYFTVINSECEDNQPCGDCLQQATNFNIKVATDHLLSRRSRRLSLALNGTSYFNYFYTVNDFRRGWRPMVLRLFLQGNLLKSVILRL